jgi:hypothetical protein
LEGSGAVSGAHPRPEDEGVAAVESDDWLDECDTLKFHH